LQDAKTDQYALAVVAYELLAGRLPFDGANPSILRPCVLQEPPKPIQGLSEEINRALLRGLAKIPHQRFSTCQEFIKAIEQGERETMSILEVRLVSINTEAKRKGDRFQFHITIEGENWSNCTLGLSGLTVNIPSVATTDTYNTIELKTRSAGCKPPYHFKTGEMIWGFLENGSFGRKPAECLFIESVLDEWEPNKRIKLEADILAPFRRMEAHVRVWATQRTSNGGTKAFGDPKWSDTQIRDQQGMPAYSLSIGFD
jgi:serine/threonine protein kinase